MKNKEYLETTFPDGTPVKIHPANNAEDMLERYIKSDKESYEETYYPVTEQTESIEADAIETLLALADKSPVIEHGAVNAVYYKDLIVIHGSWSDELLSEFKAEYPQIKHIITITDKSFNRWNKSTQ